MGDTSAGTWEVNGGAGAPGGQAPTTTATVPYGDQQAGGAATGAAPPGGGGPVPPAPGQGLMDKKPVRRIGRWIFQFKISLLNSKNLMVS